MIKLWDISSGVIQQTVKADSKTTYLAAFSPDSQQLIVVDDLTINLWRISPWSLQQSLKMSRTSLLVAFSPNGKLLASTSQASNGGFVIVELWNITKGSLQHTFQSQSNSIAFSPDSELLASGNPVRIWTTYSGILQLTLVGGSSPIVFSPNGRNLISSDEYHAIKLWDVSSGALQHSIEGDICGYCLAISPDGKLLASVSYDDTLRLWDTCTWALRQTEISRYWYYKLNFHPTKSLLMSDRVLIWTPQSERVDSSMPSKWGKTLCVMDHWITLDGENLLRLPPEYDISTAGFQAGLLALGHSSG